MNELNELYLKKVFLLVSLLYERKDYEEDMERRRWIESPERKAEREEERASLDEKINQVERELSEIVNEAKVKNVKIPLEEIAERSGLDQEGKYILMALLSNVMKRHSLDGKELLALLGYKPHQFFQKAKILNLLWKKGLISECFSSGPTILDTDFELSKMVLEELFGKELFLDLEEKIARMKKKVRDLSSGKILTVREPKITFDQVVLESENRLLVERAITQIERGKEIFARWGIDDVIKYGKGMAMLFYGPPGTGKTATAEAIAQRLSKKIGIANYARILDMWFGNSEKNLIRVFEEAKKNDCILVFDEADALFARRLEETHSADRLHNYMTNILMQEMERFAGVVILTTNREIAFDEAFFRRFLLKLKFDIPKPETRAEIWRRLIPKKMPLAEDVDFAELGKRFELTGGEIKNVILNTALECAFNGEEKVTMEILTRLAEKELMATGRKKGNQVGFVAR
ncbi:MAG: ATP-binding protein [candidate division WOR-3 bacterium]